MRQLLVEITAQPLEFFRFAQVLGRDGLVELRREGAIVRPARLVGAELTRPLRLAGVSASPMSVSSAMSADGASTASAAASGMSSAETWLSSMLVCCISSESAASPSSPDCCLRCPLHRPRFHLRSRCCDPRPFRGRRGGREPRHQMTLVLKHIFERVEILTSAVLDRRAPEIDQFLAAAGGGSRSGARAP